MKMIDYKYKKITHSFLMSLFMSCIISFIICIFNFGLGNNIIFTWLNAWLLSFVVSFPTIFMISPIIYRLVNLVTNDEYINAHK